VRTVHTGPVIGLLGQLALLSLLSGTVGLSLVGWSVGIGYGLVLAALISYGLDRCGATSLGPADRVTLTRATLAGGVTALIADAVVQPSAAPVLVALATVALVLDGVDGWVARHTRTASEFGARFDMEVDAFLIFVLSVHAVRFVGLWVLLIGLARYGFVAAGWTSAWMRATLPRRYWRKPVAATQGVVLTAAAAGILPARVVLIAILSALALLAESFGRDVWWLWRRRNTLRITPVLEYSPPVAPAGAD